MLSDIYVLNVEIVTQNCSNIFILKCINTIDSCTYLSENSLTDSKSMMIK